MLKYFKIIIIFIILYSCSPINKQHGYLLDDLLISSEKISNFTVNETTSEEIYSAMGSPSISIVDVNNVWIYLISLKEKKVFEEDMLLFQNVFRFEFDQSNILIEKDVLTQDEFRKIAFASDVTKVRRDAYGITDQLYDAFTRGQ
jgi:outer membrane protein assembly factor BamE (lipoprotein component of BamABCDE complex)